MVPSRCAVAQISIHCRRRHCVMSINPRRPRLGPVPAPDPGCWRASRQHHHSRHVYSDHKLSNVHTHIVISNHEQRCSLDRVHVCHGAVSTHGSGQQVFPGCDPRKFSLTQPSRRGIGCSNCPRLASHLCACARRPPLRHTAGSLRLSVGFHLCECIPVRSTRLVTDNGPTQRRTTHWYALRHSVRRGALRHRWYLLTGASICASSAVNSLRGRQGRPRIAQHRALTVVLAKVAHVAVTHPCPRDAVSAARRANERVRRRAYQLLMCFFS